MVLILIILFFILLLIFTSDERVLDIAYARKRATGGTSSYLSFKVNGVWLCAVMIIIHLHPIFLKGVAVDGSLVVRNKMGVDYICEDSGNVKIIKSYTTGDLVGNGRCYLKVNDGKQTLVEWNIVGVNVYLDASYVDACSYNIRIIANNLTVADSNCECSPDNIVYSPCTTYRTDNYCCLGNYGDSKSCDINTDYYRMLEACSDGVYKYAYDDNVGLKILSNTDNIFVDVFYDSLEKSDIAQGPVTSDVKNENRTVFRKFVNIAICCYLCLSSCNHIPFYIEKIFVGLF